MSRDTITVEVPAWLYVVVVSAVIIGAIWFFVWWVSPQQECKRHHGVYDAVYNTCVWYDPSTGTFGHAG